jgi:hypothetical protein
MRSVRKNRGPRTYSDRMFGQDTSAIMSTGRDVLPRHYVTFWEALARMTTPDITQAEWKIKT